MFKKLFDTKLFRWVRYVREQLENQRQNRQIIGEDRDGNKYYQYYSYWGLPIRRQIRWKNEGDFVMKDLVYYRWLHHQQFDPPTQTEKNLFYLQEKTRFEKALHWDQKQALLLQQFRKKKQELALRDQALAELQKQMLANSTLTQINTKRVSNTSHHTNPTNPSHYTNHTNQTNPTNPSDNSNSFLSNKKQQSSQQNAQIKDKRF